MEPTPREKSHRDKSPRDKSKPRGASATSKQAWQDPAMYDSKSPRAPAPNPFDQDVPTAMESEVCEHSHTQQRLMSGVRQRWSRSCSTTSNAEARTRAGWLLVQIQEGHSM